MPKNFSIWTVLLVAALLGVQLWMMKRPSQEEQLRGHYVATGPFTGSVSGRFFGTTKHEIDGYVIDNDAFEMPKHFVRVSKFGGDKCVLYTDAGSLGYFTGGLLETTSSAYMYRDEKGAMRAFRPEIISFPCTVDRTGEE